LPGPEQKLLPILLPINLVLFSILIKTNGHYYFMALLGHSFLLFGEPLLLLTRIFINYLFELLSCNETEFASPILPWRNGPFVFREATT
jgi:hypothetical protein